MRVTCLKCGHQTELAGASPGVKVSCACGLDYTYPEVHDTGVRPNARAAERSRSRAFRAAGLVKNVGGFALGIAALGVLFFPLGIVGAAIGVYVLTMLRGPLGHYSGRRAAVAAVVLGAGAFVVEGALAISWFQTRRAEKLASLQQGASEDLRALLRAERLFRAANDTYGTFREVRFSPHNGHYTLYLAADEILPAVRDGAQITDPLPAALAPGFSDSSFTAVAVANLDGDGDLDVWVLDENTIRHLQDDLGEGAPSPGVATGAPNP